MRYTKIESESYNDLPVNWKNDGKHSPLIKEFLDEILELMKQSVADEKKHKIKPVLVRFDLESHYGIDKNVKRFVRLAEKYHSNRNKYFKLYYQEEKNCENNHYHFIAIIDGKNDYKGYSHFAIRIQKIWNKISTEVELYTREENHYYKIWKTADFSKAFYAASYLAKFKDKEDRIKFRQRNHRSVKERTLSASDKENGLLRIWEVLEILKIAKSTFYAGIRNGVYPKQVKLGKTSAWKRSEILDLVA